MGSKMISLSSEAAKVLDEIREKNHCSYSGAILSLWDRTKKPISTQRIAAPVDPVKEQEAKPPVNEKTEANLTSFNQ